MARFPVLLTAAATLAAGTCASAQPALESFFSDEAISSAALSPDGLNLAYLTPMNGRVGVALQPVTSDKADVLARSEDNPIDGFFWKGNDTVLFLGDDGGSEAYALRAINIESRRVTALSNLERVRGRSVPDGGLVALLPKDPDHVVLLSRGSDGVGYYRTNLATRRQQRVRGYSESNLATVFDYDGILRGRIVIEDGKMLFQTRATSDDSFNTVRSFPADSFVQPVRPVAFLADNTTFYAILMDEEHDRGALARMNFATGAVEEVVFTPPAGEITDVLFDNERTRLIGVRYEDERERVVWMDETFKRLQATLDRAFPGTINRITDWSNDLTRIVVEVFSDVQPRITFLYDRSGPKARLMPVAHSRPDIDPKAMRPMEPIRYTARDGLEIHGYLVRPETSGGKPPPLVVIPHGGPYGFRDSWGFDPETQFLASRGYAVLRVNFRGSGGYGLKFLVAGRNEFGGKMQDDLTDAVRWAVSQGHADPERVAFVGASYGGYAALAAATFTPDLVRCIVNYVGLSDLTLIRRLPGDRRTAYIFSETWLGTDRDTLRARSPVNHIAAMRVPSLHAYGLNDPRVDIEHWNRLEAALKREGKTYESIVERGEGHGFQDAASRIAFYRRVEAFLDRNLE